MPNLRFVQLQNVIGELAPVLEGGVIQKIFQPVKNILVLRIRARQQNFSLLLSMEPGSSRCHLIDDELPNPPVPPTFCQTLRKYLDNGRISCVELAPDDRIVKIYVFASMPPHECFLLLAELSGSQANLYLLDREMKILAMLHHYHKNNDGVGRFYHKDNPSLLYASKEPNDFLLPHYLPEHPFAWSKASEIFYTQYEERHKREQKYHSHLKWLNQESARREKKLKILQVHLRATDNASLYQRWGELLKSAIYSFPKSSCRTNEVTVPDYFAADLQPVLVPVLPQFSIQENMERYFKLFRKSARTRKRLPQEITRVTREVEELTKIRDIFQQKEAEDIESLISQIPSSIYARYRQAHTASVSKAKSMTRLPYYEFRSIDGIQMLVGKTARDNDHLTFRIAHGGDLWLHTRNYPGSHVVVRCCRSEVSENTLLDAAHLAAHYSSAREHSQVEITYTKRKYVSKPKNAKAGLVSISKEKCLNLRPEPARLQRILESRWSESEEE